MGCMRVLEWVLYFEIPVARPDGTNHEIEIINTTTRRCDFGVSVRRDLVTMISFQSATQGAKQWLEI
jgi:hypothetical protein